MKLRRFPLIPTDVRELVTNRDMYICTHVHCLTRTTEIAHKIAQTWANVGFIRRFIRDEYGIDVDDKWVIYNIIHHPRNLCLSCSAHNDSFNIGNRPEQVKELVRQILNSEIPRMSA